MALLMRFVLKESANATQQQMEQYRWSSTDGAVQVEQYRWSSTGGAVKC
jgi:hypothetical protein